MWLIDDDGLWVFDQTCNGVGKSFLSNQTNNLVFDQWSVRITRIFEKFR